MSGHDETIHPDYIPEDFRELLRMACDSVWEQGELYSEDLLLAAFKPVIDEHDRQQPLSHVFNRWVFLTLSLSLSATEGAQENIPHSID